MVRSRRREPPPSLFDLPLDPLSRSLDEGSAEAAGARQGEPEDGDLPSGGDRRRDSRRAASDAEGAEMERANRSPELPLFAGQQPAPVPPPRGGASPGRAAEEPATDRPGGERSPVDRPVDGERRTGSPDRFDRLRDPSRRAVGATAASVADDTEAEPAAVRPVPLSERWIAGLLDLGLHLALGVALLLGCVGLGIDPSAADLPGIATFLLVFSFPYSVVSLAFWGATPGMARRGLLARSGDGQHLTIPEAMWRWLGAVATLLLLGLPLLLALRGGRALTDLVSNTRTIRYG